MVTPSTGLVLNGRLWGPLGCSTKILIVGVSFDGQQYDDGIPKSDIPKAGNTPIK
jgi:hypothetical protein